MGDKDSDSAEAGAPGSNPETSDPAIPRGAFTDETEFDRLKRQISELSDEVSTLTRVGGRAKQHIVVPDQERASRSPDPSPTLWLLVERHFWKVLLALGAAAGFAIQQHMELRDNLHSLQTEHHALETSVEGLQDQVQSLRASVDTLNRQVGQVRQALDNPASEAADRLLLERLRVNYEPGATTPESNSLATVLRVVEIMERHPAIRVRVRGHCDTTGDPYENSTLAEHRAWVVRNMIESAGIPEERLDDVGLGASELLSTGDDELAHFRNRRVDFRVIE